MNDELFNPELGPFNVFLDPKLPQLIIKGDEQMFNKLEDNVLKTIDISPSLFELVAVHNVRVIHISQSNANDLKHEDTFAIACQDATLIAHKVALYSSDVAPDSYILEFKLDNDI